MGRIHAVLEDEVDYGFEGGGEYNTDINDLENRFEERDSAWKFAKHRYSANFSNLDESDRDRFIEIFHACRGRRHSFLIKDWNDFMGVDQPLAVPVSTTNKVQLYKTYSFGPAYTIRPIFAFKEVQVLDASDNLVSGTMDLWTGEFTPLAAWGAGPYKWTGEFYVWVRFDSDYNTLTINAWRNHTANIELVEDPIKITATNVPMSWEE